MNFAAGSVGMIVTSFDVWASNLPRMEIYGYGGSVAHPNCFMAQMGTRSHH